MSMGNIYSITNLINGRIYVGQAENVNTRWYKHINKLSAGDHENSQLQKDYNEYGEEVFRFEVIKICELDKLDQYERFYIKKLNAFEDNGGYNATDGGKYGFNYSKGYLERLSKSLKGNERVIKARKESWTEEQREKKSKEVSKRYEDPEERKKTAEATKVGMAKLSKDKLSRKHLCKVPREILLEIVKDIQDPNLKTTQQSLLAKYEKYNCDEFQIGISLIKKLKNGKHHIYEEIKEGKC